MNSAAYMKLIFPQQQNNYKREEGGNDLDNNEVKIIKASDAFKRTLSPMTTTTSVVAMAYNDGVVMAADISGYYGKMARFKNIERIVKVNSSTILASSGDYADFQYMQDIIQQDVINDEVLNDGFVMTPFTLQSYLRRTLYDRRSKFNPNWNNFVVGGMVDGKPYLGSVDKLGLSYTDKCIATGLGMYIAVPIMRAALEEKPNMTQREVIEVLRKAMEVLFHRDTQTVAKYRVVAVTKDGVEIFPDLELEGNWGIASYVRGYE